MTDVVVVSSGSVATRSRLLACRQSFASANGQVSRRDRTDNRALAEHLQLALPGAVVPPRRHSATGA